MLNNPFEAVFCISMDIACPSAGGGSWTLEIACPTQAGTFNPELIVRTGIAPFNALGVVVGINVECPMSNVENEQRRYPPGPNARVEWLFNYYQLFL